METEDDAGAEWGLDLMNSRVSVGFLLLPFFCPRLREVRQCVSDCVKIAAVRTVSLASHSHLYFPAAIGTSVTHLKVLMCLAIVISSMTSRPLTKGHN